MADVLATGVMAVAMISAILLSDDITADTARIVEKIFYPLAKKRTRVDEYHNSL